MKITKQEEKYFNYLNKLRESGVTNMFGATPYLVKRFGIPNQLALEILTKWMENFNEKGYKHLL